ncbi:MAG: PA0069 family radical SAM protein [Ignavibacteria bacterium]
MIKQKIRGRGAGFNPGNRFERLRVEDFPDDIAEDAPYIIHENAEEENFPERKIPTQYFIDNSKSIIAKNDSEDLGFENSFNPYRGCEHGCIYCYARPSHEYLSFSAGLDFETKIMVKPNAPKLLEAELKKKHYVPDIIMFSGNTDCYQPLEKKLKLTRGALKVCLKYRNPVSLITKNSLVLRDIDVLQEMAELNLISVCLSITTLNRDLARRMEPRTSSPEKRLETIEVMAKNNIPAGVNIAPVIPGLTDEEIPAILKESSERGAVFAGHAMLRLPYSVKDLFLDWLKKEFPEKESRIINRIKEIRGGKLNSYEWGERLAGKGEFAEAVHSLFKMSCNKYHLNKKQVKLTTSLFNSKDQFEIFESLDSSSSLPWYKQNSC